MIVDGWQRIADRKKIKGERVGGYEGEKKLEVRHLLQLPAL